MEKGAAGGDPARAAVGVCEKLLTFFSKNLSMTRQKAITDGPRTGAGSDNRDKDRSKEDEEDEFMVKIERAEFEFREEEEEQKKSFTTATILGGPSTDLRSSAGASDLQQQPKEASNINQKSTDFIEQRRRGFGAGGKSSRRNDES